VARKPDSVPASPAIDRDLIRELAKLLDETGLTEIEFERDGVSVRVVRNAAPAPRGRPAEAPSATAAEAPAAAALEAAEHPGVVASPMVGTAYRGPEPGAPPFVEVGSTVKAGDTVMIIEAMKTLNQIPAPRSGRVTEILVEHAQPVEYGQPLLIIA